jgi:hypothetical protein
LPWLLDADDMSVAALGGQNVRATFLLRQLGQREGGRLESGTVSAAVLRSGRRATPRKSIPLRRSRSRFATLLAGARWNSGPAARQEPDARFVLGTRSPGQAIRATARLGRW